MMIARGPAANGITRFGFPLRSACNLAILVVALLLVPGRSQAFITFTPSGFVEDVIASGMPFATGIAFAPDG
ncbi:MAG: hypothetical protein NTZ61_04465, partial [Proteobacteria bacterium]|nr:hypothetical protein [Pseudomonadota bacterium]